MGLFDDEYRAVLDFIKSSKAKKKPAEEVGSWPAEDSLVLSSDSAFELGNPRLGSTLFLVWNKEGANLIDSDIYLVGADIQELETSAPFAMVVLAQGDFDDEYECYREMKNLVGDTKIKGLMVRAVPSRQTIWCRVSKEEKSQGLSLFHYGNALIDKLEQLDFVNKVNLLFVTSNKDDVRNLGDIGLDVGQVIGAMVKMNEEMSYDCDDCEFQEICDDVEELRAIRKRLIEKRARR